MSSVFPLSFSYWGRATKKNSYWGWLKNFTIGPIYQFLSFFLLFSVLILTKFIQFIPPVFLHSLPFISCFSHHFSFSFCQPCFSSRHFCVPLLSIFYFHISNCFWNAVLLLCWFVILLSVVPFIAIVGMFASKRNASFSSFFYSAVVFSSFTISLFWCLLMRFLICQFSSVSSHRNSIGESGWHAPCLSIPSLFQEFGVYPSLLVSSKVLICSSSVVPSLVYFFFGLGRMSKEWGEHLMWDWNVRTQWCFYLSQDTRGKPASNEPV